MQQLRALNYTVVGLLVYFYAVNSCFAGGVTSALNAFKSSTARSLIQQTLLTRPLQLGQAAPTQSAFSTLSSWCRSYGNNNSHTPFSSNNLILTAPAGFPGLSALVGNLRTFYASKETLAQDSIQKSKDLIDYFVVSAQTCNPWSCEFDKSYLEEFELAVEHLTQVAADSPGIKNYLMQLQKNEKFQSHLKYLFIYRGKEFKLRFVLLLELLKNPLVMDPKTCDEVLNMLLRQATDGETPTQISEQLVPWFTSNEFVHQFSSQFSSHPEILISLTQFIADVIMYGYKGIDFLVNNPYKLSKETRAEITRRINAYVGYVKRYPGSMRPGPRALKAYQELSNAKIRFL